MANLDAQKAYFKKMSNKDLTSRLRTHRDEQEHPERHTRYVTTKSFYGRSGVAAMKAELSRRKKHGTVSKLAGTHRAGRTGVQRMLWGD